MGGGPLAHPTAAQRSGPVQHEANPPYPRTPLTVQARTAVHPACGDFWRTFPVAGWRASKGRARGSRSAIRNPCPYALMKVVQRGFGEHLDERDRARQLEASCDYRAQCERVETPEDTPTNRLGHGATIPFGWMEKHFPTAPKRVG